MQYWTLSNEDLMSQSDELSVSVYKRSEDKHPKLNHNQCVTTKAQFRWAAVQPSRFFSSDLLDQRHWIINLQKPLPASIG